MIYRVTHRTEYEYSAPVALCHSEARLLPRRTTWQHCRAGQVEVRPRPAFTAERCDFFGNRVLYFGIQDIHKTLQVIARSQVRVDERPFSPDSASPPWEEARRRLREDPNPRVVEARQFALDSPFVARAPALADYARASFAPGRPLLQAALDLTRRVYREFVYDPEFTTVATPLDEVLAQRRGVCQDFAHLAIGCLRSLGLAARYVSGYLETIPPPGKPRLTGADASHAWLAVYLPRQGWAELDPTNDCMPGQRHIILAWGRDYADVAPLQGVMSGGGAHDLEVAVDVEPQLAAV